MWLLTPPLEEKAPNWQNRRSIWLTRDMKLGEIFKEGDLEYKRPGNFDGALGAEQAEEVLGGYASQDLKAGELLRFADVKTIA